MRVTDGTGATPPTAGNGLSALVVGGGPAGLMAAQVLAERGLHVTVYEQMPTLGRKLLLAGRSGLNLTHSEPLESLIDRYGSARRHLELPLREFDSDALRAWARTLGEDTYIGSSGRVFPDSWRATTLLRSWLRHLAQLGVRAETGVRWVGWAETAAGDDRRPVIRLRRRDLTEYTVAADVVVLALGGASWPRTGSDGSWVGILRSSGIAVNELVASNAGVEVDWSPGFLERFEGLPLKNVAVTHDGHRVRGELVITKRGLEGTPVYTLSASLRRALSVGTPTVVHLDLHPDLAIGEIEHRLRSRRPKDSFANWLRRRLDLGPLASALLRNAEGQTPSDDPEVIARRIKDLPIDVTAIAPIERAISSAGGVPFGELDTHLMLNARPGTFVAGEMVDWDAPTGGYLLQATFSMAVLAAHRAADWASQEHP